MGNFWTRLVETCCRSRNKSELSPVDAVHQANNAKSRALFFEILFYVAFLTLLVVMTYNNRDIRAFRLKQSISNSLDAGGNFNQIIKPAVMWTWARTSLVSFLHPDFNKTGVLINHGDRLVEDLVSYRIGPTRFRQHRARDGTCAIHAVVMNKVAVRCSSPWSSADRDWQDYSKNWTTDLQGQKNASTQASSNATTMDDLHEALQNISSAWVYRSWADIGGLPITGNLGVYPPGGYVLDIVESRNNTISTLTDLQTHNWVDNRTRVVIVELTLYSPNVNLFAMVTAVFEFPQAEVVMGYLHIHPFRLFLYLGNFPVLRMACDYLVYAVTVWLVVREVGKIRHERIQYFKKLWNIVQLINIMCSVSAVVLHIGRHIISDEVSKEAFRTTGQFYNFQTLAKWDELFGFLTAFVCFMAILQILNLLRFNKRMSVVGATMMRSQKELWSFMLVFILMLFAFLCFSYVTFGVFMKSYRTVVDAFESLLLIALGKMEYKLMNDVSRVLTPAFIFLYALFIVFILLNMLVSILTDNFAEVREDIDMQPIDHELIDYILSVLTTFLWRYSPFRAACFAVRKAGLLSETEPASVKTPTAPPSEQMTPTTPSSKQTTPTAPPSEQMTPTAPSSKQTTPTAPPSELMTPTAPSSKQTTPTAPPSELMTPTAPSSKQTTPTAAPSEQMTPTAPSIKQTTLTAPPNQWMTPTVPSSQDLTPTAPSSKDLTPTAPPSEQETPTASSAQMSTSHRAKKILAHHGRLNQEILTKNILRIDFKLDQITKKINYLLEMEGLGFLIPQVATVSEELKKCETAIDHASFNKETVLKKEKSKRRVTFYDDVEERVAKHAFSWLDIEHEDSVFNNEDFNASLFRNQCVPDLNDVHLCDATSDYNSMYHLADNFKDANKDHIYKHSLEVQVDVIDKFSTSSSDSSFNMSDFMYSFTEDSGTNRELYDAGRAFLRTSAEKANDRPILAQTIV